MNQKRCFSYMITLIIFICCIMAFVDAIISPSYLVKSGIKLVVFLIVPLLYSFWNKESLFGELFGFNPKNIIFPILLGLSIYAFIMVAYFLIGPYFDFSNVTIALADNYGVKKDNFVAVALYISFINSLLEEFFFRGFSFLLLKKYSSRRFAYIFSAGMFSVYHIAIMSSWFHILLFLLLIFSLFVAGLLFNWLNEKQNTIYTSWIVHMCANFAINTVGFILFGIL